MEKMYKIVRYIPQGCGPFGGRVNGARKYHGFENAKAAMYETIVEKMKKLDEKCAELIDAYCEEYYPNDTPENFELLKQFIKEYIADPAAFEKDFEEKYSDIDFVDERIQFALLNCDVDEDGAIRALYIGVTDDAKGKFPEGVISCLWLKELTHPESKRYISLTAGGNWGNEIVFSLMTEEDEEQFYWENEDWD